ncbi:hypothetical protein CHLNCDRAFT_143139 [Chlorella variabilis]|uniref:glutaredoxin-dependent peroxiredoxin n=1 Tax=Chlorella variabilis TaxID=554065 RepID=E1Z9J8_CHLVA|nr:hypothetical protein CHLNCDRAFT_143139 [Chlorella variabilis]EFN57532.1 hypothetical protein CHLNCDRAFT_143139 [Chlorella variabilis]|eukprot:XP_005849634.1 hypothetical protein CHLNCDRAFT_143139 [Chlorella variabilis]
MALLRRLAGLRLSGWAQQQSASPLVQKLAFSSAQPAAADNPFYAVPEGHQQSDLSSEACHIGLSRRKDLTLREDVRLTVKGEKKTLAELLKGEKAVVFGVPDCGKVCSEQHVPSFLQRGDELRRLGISKILCVAVGDPAAADSWAQKLSLSDGSKIQVVADTNGAFTRFLGVELAAPDAPGARSQRYAAVVDDGVLLKVRVDKSPAEAKASSAGSIVEVIKAMH